MVRKFAIEYPNAFYHVTARGSNRQNLFIDENDFFKFIELCIKAHLKYNLKIYSFCVMNNHYHLYVSTPDGNLADSIKLINENYAMYFLKKYPDKDGHVFRGRFMRKIVDSDCYSKLLIRYIHLNPVAANIVAKPQDWLWSSYRSFLNENECFDFIEYEWIKDQFGKNFIEFHEEKSALTWDPESEYSQKIFIGSEEFASSINEKIQAQRLKDKLKKFTKIKQQTFDKDTLKQKLMNLPNQSNLMEKVYIFILKEKLFFTLNEISQEIGKSPKAISKIFNRLKKELNKNDNLRKLVGEII